MKRCFDGMARTCLVLAASLTGWTAGASGPQTSPFSVAFFPKEGQTEIHARVGVNLSDYRLQSALFQHEGQTVVSTVTPGFRHGLAPQWSVELQQPVAHRWKVDALNPNVGPEGLRAPTLALAHQSGPATAPWLWRQSVLVQVNPWASSGLNQWGASVQGLASLSEGQALALSLSALRNPTTGLQTTTLTGTGSLPLGESLVQLSLGASRYSRTRTHEAIAHASEAVFAGLEYSWKWKPHVWMGVELGWARHQGRITRLPSATVPFAVEAQAHTALQTLSVTVRGLR